MRHLYDRKLCESLFSDILVLGPFIAFSAAHSGLQRLSKASRHTPLAEESPRRAGTSEKEDRRCFGDRKMALHRGAHLPRHNALCDSCWKSWESAYSLESGAGLLSRAILRPLSSPPVWVSAVSLGHNRPSVSPASCGANTSKAAPGRSFSACLFRDFKDAVYLSILRIGYLVPRRFGCVAFSCLVILRIEVCLNSTI